MKVLKSTATGKEYGVIGTPTGFEEFKVGDLLIASFADDGHIFSGLMVENEGRFCIMGACARDLKNFGEIRLSVPCELITDEIAQKLHKFKIVKPKEMTLKQIENALGYSIKIVEG